MYVHVACICYRKKQEDNYTEPADPHILTTSSVGAQTEGPYTDLTYTPPPVMADQPYTMLPYATSADIVTKPSDNTEIQYYNINHNGNEYYNDRQYYNVN